MLIDSASSATFNQHKFWHGLSGVSSRIRGLYGVIQRDRTMVSQIFWWWQTSQEHGLQLVSETNLCLFFDLAVDSLKLKLWSENVKSFLLLLLLFFLVGQLSFVAICSHTVGEVDRFFSSSGSSCVTAVLCWFQERCLLAATCPLTPSLSWHPLVHSFIFPFIHPSFAPNGSSLWLG